MILTIDIGTSSTRAILFDAEAHVVEGMVEQQPTQMATTLDGGATFDADALTETVVAVIDALLRRSVNLRAMVREATGSPVSMYSSTIECRKRYASITLRSS